VSAATAVGRLTAPVPRKVWALLLAVVAVATLLLWGWFAWRTRNLPRGQARGAGQVIEGEYRIEREIRRSDDDAR